MDFSFRKFDSQLFLLAVSSLSSDDILRWLPAAWKKLSISVEKDQIFYLER